MRGATHENTSRAQLSTNVAAWKSQGNPSVAPNAATLATQPTLLENGLGSLAPREQRVMARIATRVDVTQDVHSILQQQSTFGERLADRVVQIGGS